MDTNDLYQFVLVLVLVGIVLGVGLTVLSKFAGTTTLGADPIAQEAVNDTIDAIAEIPSNWLGVVVKGVGTRPYPAELSLWPPLSWASCFAVSADRAHDRYILECGAVT